MSGKPKLSRAEKQAYAKAMESERLVQPPNDADRMARQNPWMNDATKLPKAPPGKRPNNSEEK